MALLLTACSAEQPSIMAEGRSADEREAVSAGSAAVPVEGGGAPVAAAPFPADIRLVGLSGGGADGGVILGMGEERQRYLAVGQRLDAGWELSRIDGRTAIFTASGSGAEQRLDLPDRGTREPAARQESPSGSDSDLRARLRLEMEPATGSGGERAHRFAGEPPAAFARAGVKRGDILISYDGESFDRGEDIGDLLFILNERGRVPIRIERDGRALDLTVRN
ncbi:MAG: PDZ domain-containing protein [Pacificimonas sp.]|jgi:hypothetical protein|nr:PDZ domain-containing protein [Pacificimonas sp.]